MKNIIIHSKSIIFGIIILVIFSLTGCVSEKNRSQMFDMLKNGGYIHVGDRSYEQYDEERVVDQSPVPVNIHYYIYNMGDFSYNMEYRSVNDGVEDINTYKVFVRKEIDGRVVETNVYTFENRKEFLNKWKLFLVDVKVDSK